KGICSYYDIGSHQRAAWSYINAWPEVGRATNLVSFEPDKIDVYLDRKQLQLEPGQTVIPHGVDRGLETGECPGKAARGKGRGQRCSRLSSCRYRILIDRCSSTATRSALTSTSTTHPRPTSGSFS